MDATELAKSFHPRPLHSAHFPAEDWRLAQEDAKTAIRLLSPVWQPIETALPLIPAYKPTGYNPPWRCLLQNERNEVSEGWAYWVAPRRTSKGESAPLLRWATALGQCTTAKYWMPLPAARED